LVTVIVGIVFLLAGAFVYTYNTESPGAKIVFRVEHDNRVFGVGEDETAAILLGLGLLLLGLGALRWLRAHRGGSASEADSDAMGREIEGEQ
jgi:hypothetical protein